jgi:3',5'-cyclic AMP phosphodiesterase CpdA
VIRRVAHLSDLHFGEADPARVAELAADVRAAAPDAVAVSGDLTRRALPAEFEAAFTFLASLDAPLLVVPGNHDIPHSALWERFMAPKRRWHAARVTAPAERLDLPEDAGRDCGPLRLIGLDTVSRAHWHVDWSAGAVPPHRLGKLAHELVVEAGAPTLLVCHHPLHHALWARNRHTPRGARATIKLLHEQGVTAVLCGHLHRAEIIPLHAEGPLQVMAPSAFSPRGTGAPNGWNLIEMDGREMRVSTREVTSRGWQPRQLVEAWPGLHLRN